MSDQTDARNRAALVGGIIEQEPRLAVVLEDEAGERPDMPWVQLPGDGRMNSDFNREIGVLLTGKGLYRYKGKIVTADVNGDGKTDLICPFDYGNGSTQTIAQILTGGTPDYIVAITSGLGSSTSITYKPTTDPTVYTKDTTVHK